MVADKPDKIFGIDKRIVAVLVIAAAAYAFVPGVQKKVNELFPQNQGENVNQGSEQNEQATQNYQNTASDDNNEEASKPVYQVAEVYKYAKDKLDKAAGI